MHTIGLGLAWNVARGMRLELSLTYLTLMGWHGKLMNCVLEVCKDRWLAHEKKVWQQRHYHLTQNGIQERGLLRPNLIPSLFHFLPDLQLILLPRRSLRCHCPQDLPWKQTWLNCYEYIQTPCLPDWNLHSDGSSTQVVSFLGESACLSWWLLTLFRIRSGVEPIWLRKIDCSP